MVLALGLRSRNHGVIVDVRVAFELAAAGALAHGFPELLAPGLPAVGDVGRAGQVGRALVGVGQVQVAVPRAEEAGAAGDVGVSDQDVRRRAVGRRSTLVGDNRSDRRVDHRQTSADDLLGDSSSQVGKSKFVVVRPCRIC
jgi:hypothetical protein